MRFERRGLTLRSAAGDRVGLVYSSETDSRERSYSFTLASRQTVSATLAGMDRDIDCSVNGTSCSNHGGTADDSWSGTLAAGSHSIRVYSHYGGAGAWTITTVVHCPAGHFAHGGACHRYVVPPPPTNGPIPAFGDGPGDVLSCDGDTELPDDQECVDGIVVFKQEIVVTSKPIPVPRLEIPVPPPPGPGQGQPVPPPRPPPTGPPAWVTQDMMLQLATAIGDATVRSETCSVTTNDRRVVSAHAKLTTASIVFDGPVCYKPNGDLAAYAGVDSIPGNTIYICQPFFPTLVPPGYVVFTPSEQSRSIMHEGLHLMGVDHDDFGVNTVPGDPKPMNAAIRSACGYPE